LKKIYLDEGYLEEEIRAEVAKNVLDLGRKSKLSLENKILLYKAILKLYC